MKVEIISKVTIKPSSSTPLHLRSFRLSLLDQLAPSTYTPLVFFYPIVGDDDDQVVKFTERSQGLQRSLSETLTHFFPLAGRIKDNGSIDCVDQGVDYYEARVDCLLADILEQPEDDALKQLVPFHDRTMNESLLCLLLVQMNIFKCGGIAIGLRFSHKLCDAATFSTFLKAWSAASLMSGEPVIPDFTAATIFPPRKDIPISRPDMRSISNHCTTRRFVFDASKIVALKAKVASKNVPQPTRVEAVSALIWKCAMRVAQSNSGGSIRLSGLVLGVNLRKRIVPPLPEYSFGNMIGFFAGQTEELDVDLQSLVGQLRKGMTDFCDSCATKLPGEDGVSMICESLKQPRDMMKTDGLEFYIFTSWCSFPLYEADFGWGKPTWVGIAMSPYKNLVMLMDTMNGGVHAYVSLREEDMALFEHDPDLLAFGSPNPSVLNMAMGVF